MAMTDDEDMPKVWWSPSDGGWFAKDPLGAFCALGSSYDVEGLPEDAVELKPVSAEHVDARALELSYWFGRLQYANADDLPRLRGLMRDRIEELDEQGDAIAYTAVSAAPAAPGKDMLCASCSHRAGTHLDGVGDCHNGGLYDPCSCAGFEAPVSDVPAAPGETEWAAIHEDGTVIDCVDQDEARYYRDNPRHSHRDGYRAVRRAVIRSAWQELTDDV